MEKINIRTLVPYGDIELHVASGDNWELPLHLQWKHDQENDIHFAVLTPALGLYHSQATTLDVLFAAHDISNTRGTWIIHRKIAEVILRKAKGITPVANYKWPDDATPPMPLPIKTSKLTVDPLADDPSNYSPAANFINHICQEHNLPGSVVRIVLKAIGMEAPKWMMENRLPLDLGFCTLLAVPFRPNWKEIVAAKIKKWKLLGMLRLPNSERWNALEEAGLPGVLCSTDNIAISKDTYCRLRYTLEAIPNKSFESEAYKLEGKRQACGGTNYVATFERSVKELYPHLVQALDVYLKKTKTPFARLSESINGGVLSFSPTKGTALKIHGVGINELPVDIITPESNFSTLPQSANRVLAAATPLRQMLNLLPPASDVRESELNGEMDGQGREEETDRLPVLPPLQESHPTINLLSEGPGG